MALNNTYSPSDEDALETEAIHWLVRLTSGDISPAELKQFSRWRRVSPAHEAALTASLDLWLQLGRPLEAQHRAMIFPTHPTAGWAFALPPGRMLAGLFLLLVSVLGSYQWLNYWRFNYATQLGEFREVSLNDGSTMWLNTDSAADVEVTPARRHVRLARGEAYFDVKHNAQLPFTVDAGGGHVRVLGTTFAVKIDGKNTVVTVQRGKVIVSDSAQKTVVIQPDQAATLNATDRTLAVTSVDARRQLAWQQGLLIFENSTLSDIMQTLRRYDRRMIYLDAPQQDRLRLSASINIFRVDDWYSQLEKALPIRVTRLGPVIWVHDASPDGV